VSAAHETGESPGGLVRRAWSASPALVVNTALQLGALAVFLVLAVVDERLVTGQPVWLKPAKFAISTALYGATMAWMLSYVQGRRRAVLWVGRITTAVFVIEVALIAVQAGRGVPSHFNVSTPLNAAIFSTMGIAILVAWFTGWVALWLLARQHFEDRALGFAIRAGLIVSLIGAGLGGKMTQPTPAQLEGFAAGQVERAGAHAVGAPDDAPGLPLVGWNTQGGDLRVPHFFGLHAMQLLPILAALLTRQRGERLHRSRLALTRIAGVSYMLLVGILTLQALRGEPLLGPSSLTLSLLGTWAVGTAAVVAAALLRAHSGLTHRSDVAVR